VGGAARLHRQDRLGAVGGLDLALHVDAQRDRILGRIEMQTDNVADLGDQFGEEY
jgi:hypothetical protein